MLLLNIPLTLVTLVMVGVTLFATKKIGALSARYFIAQQKDIATVNGYIEEMMNGQKVVKVFTHEEESIADFNRLNDQLLSLIHISEPTRLGMISYAVFCLKKKNETKKENGCIRTTR